MTFSVIVLIILSIIIAAALSFYQYYYKAISRNNTILVLAFLRFITIFGILLLLINPKITQNTYEIQKTPLPIVVDNSASVKDLKANDAALEIYKMFSSNSGLKEKYDIQSYKFDNEFELSENFDFTGTQTDIEKVAKNLKSINKNRRYPTVLISDGNQTTGNDFVYSFDTENKIYPLILGDTATFLDLKINQLNVNKYAFHKNKFPVEVFLQYSGTKSITADFSISKGNNTLTKQQITFSPSKKSAVINVLLPADNVGLQVFRASITSGETEKNTYNNVKNFAVEIIDQKSEIAIVSAINHPDVGSLKRSIETNAQRKVAIVKPNEIKPLNDYNVLILYQPSASFRSIFEDNKTAGINTFIITGPNTDFAFLNQQQTDFTFKMSSQREDYLSEFNPQFNLFALDNIGFENFPPLQNAFGSIIVNSNANVLLSSKIRNISTEAPLLAFFESKGKRSAYLMGENIWKWRLQSHVDTESFAKFDVFTDKIIQFLASNNSRKSLVVTHESFYNSGDAIEISAQYFNKNYEFDDKARLTISVTNKETRQTKNYDLLKANNFYKANLDGLASGKYTFTVQELTSKNKYSSYFEILDFDIEKQFVNPDSDKLKQLAARTNGQSFMPNQAESLMKILLEDENYKAVQKEIVKKIPLIDNILLLVLVIISLALEWFMRKYNGML